MHSFHFEWTETVLYAFETSDGKDHKVTHNTNVHHNGDWSGDVIIATDGKEIEIPGVVLRQIAAHMIHGELVSVAEEIGETLLERLTK